VCRKHGISDALFYKGKAKYGRMAVSDVSRQKALEDPNKPEDAIGRGNARQRDVAGCGREKMMTHATRLLLAQWDLGHNTILPHSTPAHYEGPQRFGTATGRVIAHNQRLGALPAAASNRTTSNRRPPYSSPDE
jgi:hypothetical protein